MPTTLELLKQIQSKNFVAAGETFNTIMQDKLKTAIQTEYVAVSKDVFTAPVTESSSASLTEAIDTPGKTVSWDKLKAFGRSKGWRLGFRGRSYPIEGSGIFIGDKIGSQFNFHKVTGSGDITKLSFKPVSADKVEITS